MSPLTFDRQKAILSRCLKDDTDLADALSAAGFDYDDLRYRYNTPLGSSSSIYVNTDKLLLHRVAIPAVSFFSGAGGLDLGFEAAGFEHLGSFEANATFCGTIRLNRPKWNVFNEDLSQRERVASILADRLGIRAPFEGVFHGGPPCQSFSVAANQRFKKSGKQFKRVGFAHETYGTLLFDYVWYIQRFRPRAFLIENVPGLSGVDGGEQLSSAMAALAAEGYKIAEPKVLNASAFQVPQDRKRLFVIGMRSDSARLCLPDGGYDSIPCHTALANIAESDVNHCIRNHKAESILRYMELQYGQRDHLGRVDRLDPSLPAKTVIAGGTAGGGRSHLHPIVPRTLSPRETARLQTFPDSWVFIGPPARQLTQVGNAVPPVLGWHVAKVLLDAWETPITFLKAPKSKRAGAHPKTSGRTGQASPEITLPVS